MGWCWRRKAGPKYRVCTAHEKGDKARGGLQQCGATASKVLPVTSLLAWSREESAAADMLVRAGAYQTWTRLPKVLDRILQLP